MKFPKLKRLPYRLDLSNDGYRGDATVAWKMHPISPTRSADLFGTWCSKCLMAWGWTPDIAFVRKLFRAMLKFGCPACRKSTP